MIKALQNSMPWTDIWSEDFLKDSRPYSKLEHCLINIIAKAGAVLQRIEMSDHYGQKYELGLDKHKDSLALSIIVMSALKAANVHPDGQIDMAAYIKKDLVRRGVDVTNLQLD